MPRTRDRTRYRGFDPSVDGCQIGVSNPLRLSEGAAHNAPRVPLIHLMFGRGDEGWNASASSVKIGTIQRRLAWPLRKDDTAKIEKVSLFEAQQL